MKKYILLLGVLFLSLQFSTAQNLLQGDVSPKVQKEINERTRYLSKKLVLNPKQSRLVNKKLVEYAIAKRKIVQAKLGKKNQRRKLQALRKNNMKDMRNIMRGPQYRSYVKMMREKRLKKRKLEKGNREMKMKEK